MRFHILGDAFAALPTTLVAGTHNHGWVLHSVFGQFVEVLVRYLTPQSFTMLHL